jgi:hypothetical protein
VLYCRTPSAGETSRATEQKHVVVLATFSAITVSAPPPTGAGLTACTYNDVGSSAQRVLRYLENLKDVEADREGNKSFNAPCFLLFC